MKCLLVEELGCDYSVLYGIFSSEEKILDRLDKYFNEHWNLNWKYKTISSNKILVITTNAETKNTYDHEFIVIEVEIDNMDVSELL